jgi:colanic acid biosynthesis glycosyl transferase WcaI
MRILLHDFSGHPFQIQLSKSLAARGHSVSHRYCGSLVGPQGAVVKGREDPSTFDISPVSIGEKLERHSLVKRRLQEIKYGRELVKEFHKISPDIVISANTPLDAQKQLLRACKQRDTKFVYWLQDLLGVGTHRVLRKKWLGLGAAVGRYFINFEAGLLRQSDSVIGITRAFEDVLREYRVADEKIHTIENWADLSEIQPQPQSNKWALDNDLAGKHCFVYSGTLGMKHNPELLLRLAVHFGDNTNVRVVVISEGAGRQWLEEKKQHLSLDKLVLLDYQPFNQLSEVFGSATVLLAILEPDAGVFSVPSKVLSYHCAHRPLLLAVPEENLAARIVAREESGLTVDPRDIDGFVEAADRLLVDPKLRVKLADNAIRYAQDAFDIQPITDSFLKVIE